MKDFNKGVLQDYQRGRNLQGSSIKQNDSIIWAGNQAIGQPVPQQKI